MFSRWNSIRNMHYGCCKLKLCKARFVPREDTDQDKGLFGTQQHKLQPAIKGTGVRGTETPLNGTRFMRFFIWSQDVPHFQLQKLVKSLYWLTDCRNYGYWHSIFVSHLKATIRKDTLSFPCMSFGLLSTKRAWLYLISNSTNILLAFHVQFKVPQLVLRAPYRSIFPISKYVVMCYERHCSNPYLKDPP